MSTATLTRPTDLPAFIGASLYLGADLRRTPLQQRVLDYLLARDDATIPDAIASVGLSDDNALALIAGMVLRGDLEITEAPAVVPSADHQLVLTITEKGRAS